MEAKFSLYEPGFSSSNHRISLILVEYFRNLEQQFVEINVHEVLICVSPVHNHPRIEAFKDYARFMKQ